MWNEIINYVRMKEKRIGCTFSRKTDELSVLHGEVIEIQCPLHTYISMFSQSRSNNPKRSHPIRLTDCQ